MGSNIKSWAGQQHRRARENATILATWVYRWGWTTDQLIGRLLNLRRPALGHEFAKRGILEQIPAPPGYRERSVYILNNVGISLANKAFEELYGIFTPTQYTLHESRKIPWSIHEHNMVCQHVMLDLLGPRPGLRLYKTEPELRSEAGDAESAIADFMVIKEPGIKTYCEIELNHKADLRLKRWIHLRLDFLEKKKNCEFIVYTPLRGVYDAFSKLMRRHRSYPVERNSAGKLIERDDKKLIFITDELRRRMQVRLLQRDDSRLSGGYTSIIEIVGILEDDEA